jgi:hypothetical protein
MLLAMIKELANTLSEFENPFYLKVGPRSKWMFNPAADS